MKVKLLNHGRLFATPWTVAYQAPQSMEFSKQEYWSGLPFPSPGDLPHPGIDTGSPALQAESLQSDLLRNRFTEESSRNRFIERQYLLTENVYGFPYLQSHSQVALVVKNPPASAGRHKRRGFNPWVGKIPWRRAQQPTPVLLPGESHGQRSLMGYSPWGRKSRT